LKRKELKQKTKHQNFFGMTYEEGVVAALAWVLLEGEDPLAD